MTDFIVTTTNGTRWAETGVSFGQVRRQFFGKKVGMKIEKIERENDLLRLKLKEARDWIKSTGNWDNYKKRSKYETRHSKSTRDDIKGSNNK